MQPTPEDLFDVLVREQTPGLSAFVRACVGDPAAAEDLVQETFVAAWRDFADYDRDRPFAAWLRGIAQHRVLAHRKDAAIARKHELVAPPETVAAIAAEFDRFSRPPRGEAYRDCFAALRECLETLAGEDRDIVDRVYRGEQTCGGVASTLGRTVEWVKKRLQRARADLRDCILSKLGLEAVEL